MLNETQVAQMAGEGMDNPQDLGSNPRSEQIPYYFSFTIPMRFSDVGIPCILNDQAYTRPRVSTSKARIEEHATP